MEVLKCNRCGVVYTDEGSLLEAKHGAAEWIALCEADGEPATGLCGCPNITCPGELVLGRLD